MSRTPSEYGKCSRALSRSPPRLLSSSIPPPRSLAPSLARSLARSPSPSLACSLVRRYEPARPLREQLSISSKELKETLPPAEAASVNWLKQHELKMQWRTTRIAELEGQVELLLARNQSQANLLEMQELAITRLRERILALEATQLTTAEQIMSYIESTPILKEAAHTKKLEENPEWALVLGLGYNDGQKRNLIFQHLGKLLTEVRSITGGDAVKAKQLSDLLYCRVHAGEQRRMNATDVACTHRHGVNAGIVASISQFVDALNHAGGDGRYPDKIRQAQQVICTAVSRAAALSPTKTSVKEIAETLGLERHMIAKCEARLEALSDGEWEQLFDDRQAVRSDTMDDAWHVYAESFWTDEEMLDESNNLLNFVRRSESMSDEIRDPKDRKAPERYRIYWLEETISVMYQTMLRLGKRLFGATFHISWPYFLDLRPFYVKDAVEKW